MIAALCIAMGLGTAPQTPDEQARLARLSAARGAFESDYRAPQRKDLRIVEKLGEDDGFMPMHAGSTLWPAGSAEYRVLIIEYGAQPTGVVIYQSRHGNRTTTDWVLKLKRTKRRFAGGGTLMRIIEQSGMRIASPVSAAQRKLLAETRPYVAYASSPMTDSVLYWYVEPDGRSKPGFYECAPDPVMNPGGSETIDEYRVLNAPPIIPEEARAMGIHMDKLWHGPGKFTATFTTQPWE